MYLGAGWLGWRCGGGTITLSGSISVVKPAGILFFRLFLCTHPSSIRALFYELPQVIKFHGALPDGIFSHFSSPLGTV